MFTKVKSLLVVSGLLLCAVVASAQSVVVVNAASYTNPMLPGGSIAQGSMFIGFAGGGLGPANIAFPSPWPFPTDLAGTSIQVTVGSTTVDCFMVYTSAGQVAAILPSNTPIGEGTITVKYNGSTAATGNITVVKHSFGIFTINQQGFGPAVATDPLNGAAVYTVTNAAAPEDFIDIWGTGLGPVAFPDEGPTAPGNLGFDVKVFLGDVQVPVEYAGRSGCCSAIDQVRVKAPAGLSGCFLPVTVVVEGVTSNFGTLPINAGGGDCAPDEVLGGISAAELKGGGSLRVGNVALIRARSSLDIQLPALAFETTTDSVSAGYDAIDIVSIAAFAALVPVTHIGSCSVFRFSGDASYDPGFNIAPLDAGPQLMLSGPGGDEVVPKVEGGYFKTFGFEFPFLSPEQRGQITFPTYFEPGLTTITAPGGADVGQHMASVNVPQAFEWLNADDITTVDTSQPLLIEYAAAGYDAVNIRGYAAAVIDEENTIGVIFFCAADPNAGSFTIPRHVLMSMPDSPLIEGNGSGTISVGGSKYAPFTASGIDLGNTTYTDTTTKAGIDFN